MIITFYQFSKRNNSTKKPTGEGTDLTGDLKQDTSIITPQILISPIQGGIAPSSLYNYAYIAKFARYYFVSDWVWIGNMWQVNLRLDVLASWRASIGSSSQYVTRSASAYNLNITDTIYPATVDYSISSIALTNVFQPVIANGIWVIGVIGGSTSNSFGAITYYAFTTRQIGWLKGFLFSDDYINNSIQASDISAGLLKSIYNPYQYIASCMYYPVLPSAVSGSTVSAIKFGWWTVDIPEGSRPIEISISSLQAVSTLTITVPRHPQISRGNYLKHSPYTQYTLYFPPWGLIPIDSGAFDVATDCRVEIQLDFVTGVGNLLIKAVSNQQVLATIYQEAKQIGVPVQLAGMIVDVSQSQMQNVAMIKGAGLIGDLGQSAAKHISSGDWGGVWSDIQDFAGGTKKSFIDNASDFLIPSVHTGGVNGGIAVYNQQPGFMAKFYKITGENLAHYGRPLCENRTINTLSGFILCADADIAIPGTLEERSAIVNYLNSGFFWE